MGNGVVVGLLDGRDECRLGSSLDVPDGDESVVAASADLVDELWVVHDVGHGRRDGQLHVGLVGVVQVPHVSLET